jgi:hypothetical protein
MNTSLQPSDPVVETNATAHLLALAKPSGRDRSRPRPPKPRVPPLVLEPDGLAAVSATVAAGPPRGLAFAIHVGRTVADQLFGGDPGAWRDRIGHELTLRTIVQGARLPLSVPGLYRCLAIHEIHARLAERTGSSDFSPLTASHFRAVLDVSPVLQDALILEARIHGWSVDELRAEARRRGMRRPTRGGRLPAHPVARLVERLEREESRCVPEIEQGSLATLGTRTAEDLAVRCEGLSSRLAELARALRRG